jgi:hypothetical protein
LYSAFLLSLRASHLIVPYFQTYNSSDPQHTLDLYWHVIHVNLSPSLYHHGGFLFVCLFVLGLEGGLAVLGMEPNARQALYHYTIPPVKELFLNGLLILKSAIINCQKRAKHHMEYKE